MLVLDYCSFEQLCAATVCKANKLNTACTDVYPKHQVPQLMLRASDVIA